MSTYVNYAQYTALGYDTLTEANAERYLADASRNVDSLTFNRIVAQGYDHLTEFQQGIIQEVVCKQADFLFDNADAINSILKGYSINGVSMDFSGGLNVAYVNGIPVQSSVLAILDQSGLTWRGAR